VLDVEVEMNEVK
jgi:hypothetical protein